MLWFAYHPRLVVCVDMVNGHNCQCATYGCRHEDRLRKRMGGCLPVFRLNPDLAALDDSRKVATHMLFVATLYAVKNRDLRTVKLVDMLIGMVLDE